MAAWQTRPRRRAIPYIMHLAAAVLLVLSSTAAADAPSASTTGALQAAANWRAEFQTQLREQLYNRLPAIQHDGVTAEQTLQPHLQYQFLLPPDQLRRSIAYHGSLRRLRRVMHELREGKRPIKVGVIGGSISWGAAALRGETDWFSLVVEHLQRAFPSSNVTGRNGCVPATGSSYMELCIQEHMDDDVDLAFMEYITNDGSDFKNELGRRVYERLVRKVAGRARAPAVVMVQLPTAGMGFANEHPRKYHFHQTREDVYNTVAAYYDTPSLSLRNAIWPLAQLHQFGMNFSDFYGTTHDYVHPTAPGHKAIADMVVWLLQQTTLDLAAFPYGTADASAHAEALPLPAPMYPGNYEGVSRLCVHGQAFQDLVVDKEGWDMVNEGDELKPKWGMIATEAGATMRLVLNTTRIGKPEAPTMDVQIAYLKSYVHMGMVVARCASGCSCEDLKINGHHDSHTSTVFLVQLRPTQADRCVIELEVLQESKSKDQEHKFKVTGVMVSEYLGNDVILVLNKEKYMGAVNGGGTKAGSGAHNHHHSHHTLAPGST